MSGLRKLSFTDSNELVPDKTSNTAYLSFEFDTNGKPLFLSYTVVEYNGNVSKGQVCHKFARVHSYMGIPDNTSKVEDKVIRSALLHIAQTCSKIHVLTMYDMRKLVEYTHLSSSARSNIQYHAGRCEDIPYDMKTLCLVACRRTGMMLPTDCETSADYLYYLISLFKEQQIPSDVMNDYIFEKFSYIREGTIPIEQIPSPLPKSVFSRNTYLLGQNSFCDEDKEGRSAKGLKFACVNIDNSPRLIPCYGGFASTNLFELPDCELLYYVVGVQPVITLCDTHNMERLLRMTDCIVSSSMSVSDWANMTAAVSYLSKLCVDAGTENIARREDVFRETFFTLKRIWCNNHSMNTFSDNIEQLVYAIYTTTYKEEFFSYCREKELLTSPTLKKFCQDIYGESLLDWENIPTPNVVDLRTIEEQTKDICMEAVRQDGMQLQYVKDKSYFLIKNAVRQNGLALQFADKHTYEIDLLAVAENGLALEFVEEQEDDICRMAVSDNGLALKYVEYQTPEICEIALKNDSRAIFFVKDTSMLNIEFVVSLLKEALSDSV